MDIYDKLNAMVKKIEELDELSDEYDKLKDDDHSEHNRIRTHCLNQGALNAAEELENMVDDFTEEDLDEIAAAFDEIEDEIEAHEEEIDAIRKRQGENSADLITPLHELADLYGMAQRFDEEISARKEILKIIKANPIDTRANVTAAMRELIFALNIAEYETEAALLRRQMLAIYKEVFVDETDEDIDILIDAMQFVLSVIGDLEVVDKFDDAEELYDKLFEIDVDIFEHFNDYNNLTPLNAARSIVLTLNEMNLSRKANSLIDEFPQLKMEYDDDADADDDDDDFDESLVVEELAMEAIRSLQALALTWNEQGRYKEELNTRKRIVDIYYETFGPVETWTIRIIVNALQILQELEESLDRFHRHNELKDLRKKIAALNKTLDDYTHESPEEALQEIREMMRENKY